VTVEKCVPALIADRGGEFGRSDDVGHEHGGEDSFRLDHWPLSGQELGNLVHNRVVVWSEADVAARKRPSDR
jgi:hypothetical protein